MIVGAPTIIGHPVDDLLGHRGGFVAPEGVQNHLTMDGTAPRTEKSGGASFLRFRPTGLPQLEFRILGRMLLHAAALYKGILVAAARPLCFRVDGIDAKRAALSCALACGR